MESFKQMPAKRKVMLILPYAVSIFLVSRLAELYRLCHKDVAMAVKNIAYLYRTFPRFALSDLLLGIPAGFFIVWYAKFENRIHHKNTRKGEEYGGARFGTAEDIRPFIDSDPFNNLILSKTERLSMSPRMKVFVNNRNKHVVVYGSSGAGKTYSLVKPNMYQMHSSLVVTDPKGTLLPETGMLFYRKGYRIKVLDTVDLENSMHFNPFAYIRTPKDILTLANTLFTNLKPPDSGTPPDPFFDQAALLWLQATIGLLWYEAPPEEQTIPSLLEILEADEVREDDETYENAVDLLFKDLEKKNPRHFAVKQRKKYKKAAGVIR